MSKVNNVKTAANAMWRVTSMLFCLAMLLENGVSPGRAQEPQPAAPSGTPSEVVLEKPIDTAIAAPAEPIQPLTQNDAAPPNFVSEDLIHPGDTIEIDVLGSLEYDWRGTVDELGALSELPGLENTAIPAACRTVGEIEAAVVAAYRQFLREPAASVRTVNRTGRQTAVLFGSVRQPQRVQIERPVRVQELLIVAGGVTDRASGKIEVFRPAGLSCAAPGQVEPEAHFIRFTVADLIGGKPEANPFVRTGDVVTVDEAVPVFVTGGVAAPQRVLYREGLTLERAIASVGGVSRGVDASQVTVYRREPTGGKVIVVDYERIRKKQAADFPLQAYDVVEVSLTGEKPVQNAFPGNLPEITRQNPANLPLRVIK